MDESMEKAREIREVSECYRIILSMFKTKPGETYSFPKESRAILQERISNIIKNLLIDIVISGQENEKYKGMPDDFKMALLFQFDEFICHSPRTKRNITIINPEIKQPVEQPSEESMTYLVRVINDIKKQLEEENISIDNCFEQVRNCSTHTGMRLQVDETKKEKYVILDNGKIRCKIPLKNFSDLVIVMFNENPIESIITSLQENEDEHQKPLKTKKIQIKSYTDLDKLLARASVFFGYEVKGYIRDEDLRTVIDSIGEVIRKATDPLSIQDINDIVKEKFPEYSEIVTFTINPRAEAQIYFYIKCIGEEIFFGLNGNTQDNLIELYGQQEHDFSAAEVITIGALERIERELQNGNDLSFDLLMPEEETKTFRAEFYKEAIMLEAGEESAGEKVNTNALVYMFPKLYEVLVYSYMIHIFNYVKENITPQTLSKIYETIDISDIELECTYSETGMAQMEKKRRDIERKLEVSESEKAKLEQKKTEKEHDRRRLEELKKARERKNDASAVGIQKGVQNIEDAISDIDDKIRKKDDYIREQTKKIRELCNVLEGRTKVTKMNFFRHLRNAVSHKTFWWDFQKAQQTGLIEDIIITLEDQDEENYFIGKMTIKRFLELAEEIVAKLEIAVREEEQPRDYKYDIVQEVLRYGISIGDMPREDSRVQAKGSDEIIQN